MCGCTVKTFVDKEAGCVCFYCHLVLNYGHGPKPLNIRQGAVKETFPRVYSLLLFNHTLLTVVKINWAEKERFD